MLPILNASFVIKQRRGHLRTDCTRSAGERQKITCRRHGELFIGDERKYLEQQLLGFVQAMLETVYVTFGRASIKELVQQTGLTNVCQPLALLGPGTGLTQFNTLRAIGPGVFSTLHIEAERSRRFVTFHHYTARTLVFLLDDGHTRSKAYLLFLRPAGVASTADPGRHVPGFCEVT